MTAKNTEDILGYPVTTLRVDAFIDLISSWVHQGCKQKYFVCANPHSLIMAQDDDIFQSAIKAADLIVPDGSGIVFASKILGGNIKSMITGSDVFRELSLILNKTGGYRYFFLGATDITLKRIQEKMRIDYPDIHVAGVYSPPYKPEFSDNETNEMIDRINQAEPHVLWVGLTAPKQEKWVYRNRARLDVRFIGPVGAVFDFYTERIKRSHPIFLKYGLEWLPRLLREPGRLWKRSFMSAPRFIYGILKQKRKMADNKNNSLKCE